MSVAILQISTDPNIVEDASMSIYLPYVYKVTNKHTKEFYIGMRSANKDIAENDLGIKYFTSNKKIKENFKDFNIEIIAYFKDWETAFLFENHSIKEEWGNPNLLNKHYQETISSFSMKGYKRTDLGELNKALKRKPKEIREYKCSLCGEIIQKEEFCHHQPKTHYYCNARCRNLFTLHGEKGKDVLNQISKRKSTKGRIPWNKGLTKDQHPSLESASKKLSEYKTGKPAWNKGLPNNVAAENGKKGAIKQSETVAGRKKKVLSDSSWVWEYPTK